MSEVKSAYVKDSAYIHFKPDLLQVAVFDSEDPKKSRAVVTLIENRAALNVIDGEVAGELQHVLLASIELTEKGLQGLLDQLLDAQKDLANNSL